MIKFLNMLRESSDMQYLFALHVVSMVLGIGGILMIVPYWFSTTSIVGFVFAVVGLSVCGWALRELFIEADKADKSS